MTSDAALVEGFERGSLEQFHHADHVQLSIVYLARYGRDEALERLTACIRQLATAAGHPEKFHVTMTRAWLDLIDAARDAHPYASGAAALVAACPELLDKFALDRCYSRELLYSDRARTEWIPPDVEPLSAVIASPPDRKPDM